MNKTTLNSQKEKHSMLSLRRATFRRQRARRGPQHFYPRSPCGERPAPLHMCHRVDTFLSTLSLRRATAPPAPQGKSSIFLSTLSLRRATRETVPRGGHIIFLSTLSLRRATHQTLSGIAPHTYFYPRSPCGERRRSRKQRHRNKLFLSTLSLRRATRKQ